MPITHGEFFPRVYEFLARKQHQQWRAEDPVLGDILGREYLDLSERVRMTKVQEECSVRNVLRARALAKCLFNEDGKLDMTRLEQTEQLLVRHLYPLGPDRQHDVRRQEHLLHVIRLLKNDSQLQMQLQRIGKPSNHRMLEQVIRDTLQLEPGETITDTHARQATLAAWLTYLRQNVGSCFATAPCIIIQTEQPHQFLSDIEDLMNMGRLKRTFEGVEYTAPVSSTWGAGDLRRRFGLWRNPDHSSNTIWYSPGLITAFQAVKLIDRHPATTQDIAAAKALVTKLLAEWESDRPYVITSVEDLIRRASLQRYALTEEDIQDYFNRPKPMLQGDLMVQVPTRTSASSSKGDRCAHCLADLEVAGNTFKGLTDSALLRTWEFTVASFAETKANFTKWNLYSSLGLKEDEPGGIGYCLHQHIQHRLEQCNREVHQHQEDYEQQYTQIQYLEARIKRASTEQELKWLNIEYQMKRNEFYTIETLRNRAHYKAQRYANLFAELVNTYVNLFPQYFQEVYDADLHEVDVGPYDDSPAGFRLLFKHGRNNTSAWTRIYTPTQYVEALASFFTLTESVICGMPEFEGMGEDIGQIITTVVMHIKTQPFIESALYRCAVAKGGRFVKDPLKHLEQLEKKPWAYTSGGNMETLLSCYFRSNKHTSSERWVENEMELAVYLLDLIKKMPPKISENYLRDKTKSLLMHSPTHAFLFRPGFPLFRAGVSDKLFTYTWVRDTIFNPAKRFVAESFLDRELMIHLINTLEKELIPKEFVEAFRDVFYTVPGRLTAIELRTHILKEIQRSQKLFPYGQPIISQDDVDSFLYKHLPVSRPYDCERRAQAIVEKLTNLPPQQKQAVQQLLPQLFKQSSRQECLTSLQLQNCVKATISLVIGPKPAINIHKDVAEAAQTLGLAMPTPLTFADTNWVTDFFAFTTNPGTGEFQLWRVDETGSQGAPITHWKQWLNGSRHTPTWGVFTNPAEYRS